MLISEQEQKEKDAWFVRQLLELTKSSVRLFANTKDEKFWELAKWFGEKAREMKRLCKI